MGRAAKHLPDGVRLEGYVDGPARDCDSLRHVRGCRQCQVRIREARLLRLLLHAAHGTAGDGHIDPGTLSAFAEERLGNRETEQVMRHLAHCEDCLLEFSELHRVLTVPPQAAPPWRSDDLAAPVRSAPDNVRVAGRLVVTDSGAGLSLRFKPGGFVERASRDIAEESPMEQASHPAPGIESQLLHRESSRREGGLLPVTIDFKKCGADATDPNVSELTGGLQLALSGDLGTPQQGLASGKPQDSLYIDLGQRSAVIAGSGRAHSYNLRINISAHSCETLQRYQVALVTLGEDRLYAGRVGRELVIGLCGDALALRFEGEAFDRPVEIDLQLPQNGDQNLL